MANKIDILDHPVALAHLTVLRDVKTGRAEFNLSAAIVTGFVIDRATADLKLRNIPIETPMEEMMGLELDEPVVGVMILRAALSMLPAFQQKFPNAEVGFLDIRRDEETADPVVGGSKLPKRIAGATVLIMDPMLATAGSMCETIRQVSAMSPKRMKVLTLIAAPEGVSRVQKNYPEVQIFTGSVDRKLNTKSYILPGLGDAGDRAYGEW